MSLIKMAARIYQKSVHKSLAQYGLRYEDIIIHENPDLQKALKYIPEEEVVNRNRRLRRAIDLSSKHSYLPKDIQAKQEPGKFYLADAMYEMQKLREEREKMFS